MASRSSEDDTEVSDDTEVWLLWSPPHCSAALRPPSRGTTFATIFPVVPACLGGARWSHAGGALARVGGVTVNSGFEFFLRPALGDVLPPNLLPATGESTRGEVSSRARRISA